LVGSLQLAVAGATGVSCGIAHVIPALFSPLVGGRKLTDYDMEYSASEDVYGEACHKLSHRSDEYELDLWISKSRHIIRKISEVEYIDYNEVIPEVMERLDSAATKEAYERLKALGINENMPSLDAFKEAVIAPIASAQLFPVPAGTEAGPHHTGNGAKPCSQKSRSMNQ